MTTTTALSKLSAIIILLSLLLIAAYPVIAQDATTPATTRKDRIEERKERIEDRMEAKKERVEGKMEERKARIATREAALKAKLEKFRDKKKAEIADRVNTNLNRINQKQTEQMLKHLDRMTSILTKLEVRVNSAKPDVKDVVLAKEAVAGAKAAINSATEAVKAQAEKDYTISVSSEGTVRKDAQKAREQLHSDLKAVRVQVIDAKQAVANAIRVAKSGKVEVPGKEGTPSGRE